jgi:hypothetical protein
MELPKLTLPKYELTLPSTGEKILFRPFTVKEEELLLIAIDDDDDAQIRALHQVLDNCLLPDIKGKKLDVTKLAVFDLDYIWLKIRSKSVEEIIALPFECQKQLPESEWKPDKEGVMKTICGTIVNIAINLDQIEVKKNPENNPKIELQDSIGIVLKYPTFDTLQKLSKIPAEKDDFSASIEVIIECIDMIYDGKNGKTYEKEYLEKEQLKEFLENLSQLQFEKVMKFFDTLPVLRHNIHFKCPKCKHEADVIVEGTKSFLA